MTTLNFLKPNRQIDEKTFHPLANIFPAPSPKEYEALKADILRNGQRVPILLSNDQILDGRARYQACLEEGIAPFYEHTRLEETALLSHLISLNVHRRHLDETQRAWIGAKIYNALNEDVQICTRDEAAKMMNISSRSLASALAVQKSGIEGLHPLVEQGTIPVSLGEKISRYAPHVQKRLIGAGNPPQIRRELGKINAYPHHDGQEKLHDIRVSFSAGEIKQLNACLRASAHGSLQEFIREVTLAACSQETYWPNEKLLRLHTYGKSCVRKAYSDKAYIPGKSGMSRNERDEASEFDAFLASPFANGTDGNHQALDRAFEDFKRNRQQ